MSSTSITVWLEPARDPAPMIGVLHASDKLLPSSTRKVVRDQWGEKRNRIRSFETTIWKNNITNLFASINLFFHPRTSRSSPWGTAPPSTNSSRFSRISPRPSFQESSRRNWPHRGSTILHNYSPPRSWSTSPPPSPSSRPFRSPRRSGNRAGRNNGGTDWDWSTSDWTRWTRCNRRSSFSARSMEMPV